MPLGSNLGRKERENQKKKERKETSRYWREDAKKRDLISITKKSIERFPFGKVFVWVDNAGYAMDANRG